MSEGVDTGERRCGPATTSLAVRPTSRNDTWTVPRCQISSNDEIPTE
jgi:hypothetical protein